MADQILGILRLSCLDTHTLIHSLLQTILRLGQTSDSSSPWVDATSTLPHAGSQPGLVGDVELYHENCVHIASVICFDRTENNLRASSLPSSPTRL
jgi:hypothetical protein